MIQLRPYQSTAVERIRDAYRSGQRRVVFVLPTGGGKTFTFAYMVAAAAAKGRRVLVLAHRRELIEQASDTFTSFGIEHGLIMAGTSGNGLPVQVGMVQTVTRRLELIGTKDFIVVDECHHSSASTYRRILGAFPLAHVLGVTATPARTDGTGLGEIYQTLVEGPSMHELIDQGALADYRLFGPAKQIDLSGIRTAAGEYRREELAERVDRASITGDAVDHYRRICPGARAIAFCVSIRHAEHVAETFRAAGIPAERIDGEMDYGGRASILERFDLGVTRILTSVDLVSEGFDLPALDAAILLRPTQSLILHLQQIGRSLRPAPGKQHAIILDHASNTERHGFPDEPREWSLEGRRKGEKQKTATGLISLCKACFAYYPGRLQRCPHCSAERIATGRTVQYRDGRLVEITPDLEWRESVLARGGRIADWPGEGPVEIVKASSNGTRGVTIGRRFVPFAVIKDGAQLRAIQKALGYKPDWAPFQLWLNTRGRPPRGDEIGWARKECVG